MVLPDAAETARLESELFHHLIDRMTDYAIFTIDIEGKIATWNPGVARLFGFDEQAFVGQPFSLIFTSQDTAADVPRLELEHALKSGRAEDERWHRKKDGTLFWGSGLVTPIHASNGTVTGFAKIMRDQTAKKKYEEELARQANSLAIANRELVNFAGVISHDLNTPLQTVNGFAHLLKNRPNLDPESAESLSYIVEGTERMLHLIAETLRLTTSNGSSHHIVLADADALVHEVLEDLQFKRDTKSAKITCDDLPKVWCEPMHLKRIFQNLIENAIKYSAVGRDPIIHVTSKLSSDWIIFSVSDNGIGIKKADIPRIFALFERIGHHHQTGHGIGLAVCRKLIEQQGGEMWVHSKIGEGAPSTFHCHLVRLSSRSLQKTFQTQLLHSSSGRLLRIAPHRGIDLFLPNV